jgi:hypothetical protein
MWNLRLAREAVSVLMESPSYFRLSLKERYLLVKQLITPPFPPLR